MKERANIDEIVSRGKELEFLYTSLDPLFNKVLSSTEIVKNFIIDRKLIIYGGTAIDYALRLVGDKIYPDNLLLIPDLDFYSPNHIKDAYDLTDLIYDSGCDEARAIKALHPGTMKVDCGSNHWIADVSFVPAKVFSKLPCLNYAGMSIIHPDFQRIDIHSSLSHPYDNAPREVVFDRWEKDIARFNKLNTAYPMVDRKLTQAPKRVSIKRSCVDFLGNDFVFHGFAAYGLIFRTYKEEMKGNKLSSGVITGDFIVLDDSFEFLGLDQTLEVVSDAFVEEVMAVRYESIMNIIPPTVVLPGLKIHDTTSKLVSIVEYEGVKCVNIQYLLKYFLAMNFVTQKVDYLCFYLSLLKMIDDLPDVFLPSVEVYGRNNLSESTAQNLNRILVAKGLADNVPSPMNYNVKGVRKRDAGHPEILEYEFMNQAGREVKKREEGTVGSDGR